MVFRKEDQLYSKWTSHILDEEEKVKFEKTVRASAPVLERLKQIVEEDLEGLDSSEINSKIYDLPNWDYRQAHRNGNRQAYLTLIKLLDLDQQKRNI